MSGGGVVVFAVMHVYAAGQSSSNRMALHMNMLLSVVSSNGKSISNVMELDSMVSSVGSK